MDFQLLLKLSMLRHSIIKKSLFYKLFNMGHSVIETKEINVKIFITSIINTFYNLKFYFTILHFIVHDLKNVDILCLVYIVYLYIKYILHELLLKCSLFVRTINKQL